MLNDKQKKLVDDNHSLILYYLKRYGFSYEEYYDVLAISLCEAAQYYDSKKGAFSTIAMKFMNNKMYNVNKESNLKRKIPKSIIYNYDDVRDIEYNIGSVNNTEKCAISKLNIENKLNKLFEIITNEKDRKILYYRLKGLTVIEIGKILDVTHQCISQRIRNIRKQLRKSEIFQEI